MVTFLIHRPIAVLVSTFAILILGLVASQLLPISLMPDVEIPEITVQVKGKNQSARELEEVIVGPLRRELLQVPKLEDIESATRAGVGILKLKFAYGSSIDYAFLDVNEHVDAAMTHLPRETERPHIIKASATDLPVFYLNLSYKTQNDSASDKNQFLELSEFAEEVIQKRLEQLPEVALVDITGRHYPEIQILPDYGLMQSLGINHNQLQQTLEANNVNLGNLLVQEGKYQYNIRFSSYLRTKEDIANIYLNVDDRIIQIKDIAEVKLETQVNQGAYLDNGKEALGLAIIKQSDARMSSLEEKVKNLTNLFEKEYPEIAFSISQDQTKLLDYSIDNLSQSLLWGGLLAFIILFLFLKDSRAPWLIGLTIPISIVISLLFFYLFKISINIISLSGLVLGVGLMIDNAIIVIDNISQQRRRGLLLEEACIIGTNEVIRPLISSSLTTSSVFIPLIFLSGISGALFLDQALAITIGLGSSLVVSITFIPTLYRLFYKGVVTKEIVDSPGKIFLWYKLGLKWSFKFPLLFITCLCALMGLGILLGSNTEVRQLPKLEQSELLVELDWNEPLNIVSHKARIQHFLQEIAPYYEQSNAEIGTQQFVLNSDQEKSSSELKLYLQTNSSNELIHLKDTISNWFLAHYPNIGLSLNSPPNVFERLFTDKASPLLIRLTKRGNQSIPAIEEVESILTELSQKSQQNIPAIPHLNYQLIEADLEMLTLYEVNVQTLYKTLQTVFRARKIGLLQETRKEIPIILAGDEQSVESIISESYVRNENGQLIPIASLIHLKKEEDYQTLVGGKNGNYTSIMLDIDADELGKYQEMVKSLSLEKRGIDYQLDGKLFTSKQQLIDLAWIMGIALLMLYFILAAQFESLTQPFIVLLEVPIDLAAAILFLWLAGASLNLMSMIGMIVMSGIIINDSILKIDTINRLRENGLSLKDAIQEAGKRRLTPIIMTSLTTILAVLPFLFTSGLGADLQKPLAWALIGGMSIGTLVSLYFIPLSYYFLYRNESKAQA